jgi:hypothetical protein
MIGDDDFAAPGVKVDATPYEYICKCWISAVHESAFDVVDGLVGIIANARDGGLIDWNAIEDRHREVVHHSSWDDPREILHSAASSYREDVWRKQRYRPEVWIEKAALLGVIEGVCREFRVRYFATIGSSSQTLLHDAGARSVDDVARYLDQGLIPVVLHLADHDPNGIDMTRDVIERLERYASRSKCGVSRSPSSKSGSRDPTGS